MEIEFIDPAKISHAEFVRRFRQGEIILTVNTNAAGYLFRDLLSEYAWVQSNFRSLFFLGFIGGGVAIFFVGWWSLLGFLIGALGLIWSRRHTDRSVIDAAVKSERAYRALAEGKILAMRR